jgi:tRNA (guanine37-N1)-methyltransferase
MPLGLCVSVEKSEAEAVRRKLLAARALDFTRSPSSDSTNVYFPVVRRIPGLKHADRPSAKLTLKPRSMQAALEGKLPAPLMAHIPHSFDIIGDIAIIEIPKELAKHAKLIGRGLMEAHHHVKSVYAKAGKRVGKYRTRKLLHLAGAKRTTTIHREAGCEFELDIAKAYFSPRLVHERDILASQAKPDEKILALFAGVGPFPIILAKRQPRAKIIAIELNPVAAKYLAKNIARNNLEKQITAMRGDVSKLLPQKYRKWADRIIMSYPDKAEEFLGSAFASAKKNCTIHFYCFAPEATAFADAEKIVKEAAKKAKRKIKITGRRVVLPYAPRVVQVAIDFRVLN